MGPGGLLLRVLAIGVILAARAAAQDPLPLYPENYRVLTENDRVRVLDFRLKRGATERSHAHPAHVVYVVAPFEVRFTFPDGRTGIRKAAAGDVLFSEAVTHATENIGGTDAHGILVELKSAEATSAALRGELPADALTAVTFIRGPREKEAEIRRELMSLTGPTRAEPGALRYDLYQSVSEPGAFMRFEAWRSPEALETHKATPHLRASFERRKSQQWMTEITLWRRVPE
ncbi:MAG: antibiotic biosynthesis monooxygenase [Actinomycetota bacterium]|nr:antibiotic biosynthesis monooxygenase [Actinomycetota bacterium]